MKNQAKFHPLKFMYALAEKAEAMGAEIFEHSEVLKLETVSGTGKKDKAAKKNIPQAQRVITKKGVITTDAVIVATYIPFDNPLTEMCFTR